MRIGIFFVFTDYHRRGAKNRVSMQPQIGPLIAGLLPDSDDIEIVNETWEDIDFSRSYDLVFVSVMHSDFDRARQVSHYFRRRGALTVVGGYFASAHPGLCGRYFDAVAIGDPEDVVPRIRQDAANRRLLPVYRGMPTPPSLRRRPRYELIAGRALHPLGVEASRGCPFTCEFCVLNGAPTGFRPRPVADVIGEIRDARERLKRLLPRFKWNILSFTDNNFGGQPSHLRALCAALEPLKLRWVAAVTLNVITRPDLVAALSRAGCQCVFVGLESFNPAALADMKKHQNAAHKVRAAIDLCLDHGIVVMSGLMVSPLVDDLAYLEALPDHLRASGLGVPTFMSFETPLPGTPHFSRLAASPEPAFMPGALLRDFNGYTLTTRPRHAEPGAFVEAFLRTQRRVFAPSARLAKLAYDLPRLARRGRWFAGAVDVVDMLTMQGGAAPAAGRTLIAGTDAPPPETVPLTDADFETDAEREDLMRPLRVADEHGFALPAWRPAQDAAVLPPDILLKVA